MTRELFTISGPLGFAPDPEQVCSKGHPVALKHVETGQRYFPLLIGNTPACLLCLNLTCGVQCNRSHMGFEVGTAE